MTLLHETISPQQWHIFFHTLSQGLPLRSACEKSKIARATAYRARKTEQWVAERWQEALDEGAEYLEEAAHERAVNGVTSTRNIYDVRGRIIAQEAITKYSDRLLLAMLAARNPAYRFNSSDQVQARVLQELTKMLDLLQKKLSPEIYQTIIDLLASDEFASETSQEAPRYLNSGESLST